MGGRPLCVGYLRRECGIATAGEVNPHPQSGWRERGLKNYDVGGHVTITKAERPFCKKKEEFKKRMNNQNM